MLSPQGKYVIYFNGKEKNYFSYEVSSGRVNNITRNIRTRWTTYGRRDEPLAEFTPAGIAGWADGGSAALIYDQNDIWKINLTGTIAPVNVTNGFGKRNSTVFKLIRESINECLPDNEHLILSAFNRETKKNGFFSKALNKSGDPALLTMDRYVYYVPGNEPSIGGLQPIKASNKNIYLVERMSATESPNYFVTRNFKEFIRISDIHPEQQVKWMTSQLVKWKSFSAEELQGVLYKPEDFDPNKKYPIIFYYYERLSDHLNEFLHPGESGGPINIPYFVSNDYLVFTPDIHYTLGNAGMDAYNSVVSAAKFFTQFSWVDSKRMALQGHSFGGYETNYILTMTNLFAAAMSASGVSDFISGYLSLRGQGNSSQWIYEFSQSRIGATLWEKPEAFIKNSPVVYANRISTPLLFMNNRDDGNVPFEQGLELFLAMRRLGKRAWLLQYDGMRHGLSGKSALDYTIRLKQYFDHYLKDSACPRWLLYGVPASQKGIDNGYELIKEKDPKTGKLRTPKESDLLTDEEKKKVEALRKRKSVTVTIE
ncbi:MAG: S9 family peptidase [Chitinophagaceae bacterium]|nr:S9 family peptidase [Chitinophagaceae bacterium]